MLEKGCYVMGTTYTEMIQISKTNKIASLYPTTKLMIVAMYIVCTLVIGSIKLLPVRLSLLLIPQFLFVPLLCKASGVTREGYKTMKELALFSLMIFLVQAFLVPGGELLFRWGFLKVYSQGLDSAIKLSFGVMNIAGIFVWLVQTTDRKEMTRALEDSGVNYKTAYVMLSAFRMIDVLSQNSKRIMDAQKSRGIETEGNLFVRVKAFVPIILPLLLTAVISLEEQAMTLEARGFLIEGEKTHLLEVKRNGYESYALIVAIGITGFIVLGRIVLWMR